MSLLLIGISFKCFEAKTKRFSAALIDKDIEVLGKFLGTDKILYSFRIFAK